MTLVRKAFIFAVIIIGSFTLYSCGDESLSVEITETGVDAVVQGADDFGKASVGENGVLRLKDNHLMYFDYQSQKDYVICTRANCNHNDKSCSGWYGNLHEAKGLAEYCGKLYCFLYNEDKHTLDLVQMERDGSKRKVISEIKCGDNSPGSWTIEQSFTETYYTKGKVITILNWIYNPKDESEEEIQTEQCVIIDLESGKHTDITERKMETFHCKVDAVSNDYCIINLSGEAEKLLNEKDFYSKFEAGEFDDNKAIKNAENPYEAYYEQYSAKITKWYKFILFDLNKNKSTLLKEGNLEKAIDENGDYYADLQPFYITGMYKDYAIIETVEESLIEDEGVVGVSKNKIYKWDFINDKKELILDINNGYVFDAGGLDAGVVVDQNLLLFLKRKPDMKADYYSYNIDTGEEKKLYEAERDVPYRIAGETADNFIYYTYDDVKKSMYMIEKEDYYNGDFDKSIRMKGLDEEF